MCRKDNHLESEQITNTTAYNRRFAAAFQFVCPENFLNQYFYSIKKNCKKKITKQYLDQFLIIHQ